MKATLFGNRQPIPDQEQPLLAAAWRFIRWQRVPASRLPIRRPALEATALLAFALAYPGLSALTGLVIRTHPLPILGASYFTSDVWYVLGFKILGLLVVPLVGVRLLGYRLGELVPDGRLRPRDIVVCILAFAAGALLNSRHFGPIAAAAGRFGTGAVVTRATIGLLIPLVSAAIPEELVYRGLLQTRLERVAGRIVAVLLTALLFTAWHLPSRYLLASGIEGTAGNALSVLLGTGAPVFVIGLLFGLLYDRYRRLLPLIAAHWGIDAVVSVGAMLGLPL